MTTRHRLRTTLGALLFLAGPQTACAAEPTAAPAPVQARAHDLSSLATLALDADPSVAADARLRLRAAGPAGLAAFIAVHTTALERTTAATPPPGDPLADLLSRGTAALDARVAETLDEICAQKDCAWSRLYWYTDLELARDAARASGKPIVSLRLLGDLTDELSCANSRLFRALLYPDPIVAAVLREQFVLHWASERPAPKITIDLGDGRSVVSTITGNSVHYVLDSAGRPVDALPGLLTPRAFADGLRRAADLARATAGLTGDAFAAAVRRHHDERIGALARAWDEELAAAGPRPRQIPPTQNPGPTPRAGQAAPLAVSKMRIEAPLLGSLGEPVDAIPEAPLWDRLTDRHAHELELGAASLRLLQRQQWRSGDPARDAADFAQALAELRRAVTLDTLRNGFELHRQVHQRLRTVVEDLPALNRWMYSELFLTPQTDPWLGLAAPTIYSGLPGGGRRSERHI